MESNESNAVRWQRETKSGMLKPLGRDKRNSGKAGLVIGNIVRSNKKPPSPAQHTQQKADFSDLNNVLDIFLSRGVIRQKLVTVLNEHTHSRIQLLSLDINQIELDLILHFGARIHPSNVNH